MNGRVYQLNVKGRNEEGVGLPKRAIEYVTVRKEGLEGDFNHYRHNSLKNSLDHAVSIMPIEMINQLNREGWSVKPGDLGENITIEGIAYNSFKVGDCYLIGTTLLQISEAITPCKKLVKLPYVGEENRNRFVKDVMLGRRGWYARVLEEGFIRKGDLILLR